MFENVTRISKIFKGPNKSTISPKLDEQNYDSPETKAAAERLRRRKLRLVAKQRPIANEEPAEINAFSLEAWVLVTTWHGIIDLYCAKKIWLKITWITIIGLCVLFAVNDILALFTKHVRETNNMASIHSYENFESDPVQWPNMTIINLNWLDQSALAKLQIIDPYSVPYLLKGVDGIRFHFQFFTNKMENYSDIQSRTERKYREYLELNNTTREQIIKGIAKKCEDMFIHCGKVSQNNFMRQSNACCENTWYSIGNAGAFHVNLGDLFGARTIFDTAGYIYGGIYFLLDSKSIGDYPNIIFGEKPSSGFRLSFYYGDAAADSEGSVMIAPGSHAIVGLTAERRQSKKIKAGFIQWNRAELQCLENPDSYHYRFVNASQYSATLCRHDCKAQYLVTKFGCTCQSVQVKHGDRYCASANISACLILLNEINEIGDLDALAYKGFSISECLKACINPCTHDIIKPKISYAKFPAENQVASLTEYLNSVLNKSYSEKDVRQLTLLEIYFESNQLMIIEQVGHFSSGDLIGRLGGSLHFWCGISVITIMQGLVYLICGTKRLIDQLIDAAIKYATRPEPVYMKQEHWSVSLKHCWLVVYKFIREHVILKLRGTL